MASSGIDKDSLSDALCKFKDQFKGRLSVEQSRQFRFTTREELRSTIVEVQKQQATERRLQNMKRLKRFLDTMDSFGKVIDVFANVNEFVPFIWGYACVSLTSTSISSSRTSHQLKTLDRAAQN